MNTPVSPLHFVLVAQRFQRNDGQGRVNFEVALSLLRQGFRITLLASQCANELAEHPNAKVVLFEIGRLPTQLLKNLSFAQRSAKWLRANRGQFDLVQGNGFVTWEKCDIVTAHFVHSAWAKNPYYPFNSSWRPYNLYQRAYTTLNARWEKKAFLGAKRIIAVSEVVARDIEALGIQRDHIDVIYNGVDTVEFSPGPSLRDLFNLPDGVCIALFVGDIKSPRKNLDTLLKAMSHLPYMHLAVAGSTPGSTAPERARALGVSERVHFLGKVSNIAVLMRSVDMFVFPSRYEAHPLVVLEAMASGLPIILSKNIESVSSFQGAFEILHDPEDDKALAVLMKRLMDSPETRQEMGREARSRAAALQWYETTSLYLATYLKVLALDR